MKHKKRRVREVASDRSQDIVLDLAVLEDRTLYSGTPIPLDIDVAEDAANSLVDLQDLLELNDSQFNNLDIEIQENSNSDLFDLLIINSDGQLEIDYAENQNGSAKVLLKATSNSLDREIEIDFNVESINDAPIFLGFDGNVTQPSDGNLTIIDLFASFDDVEDSDSQLSFQLVNNSNEDLFRNITIDQSSGTLTFEHFEDASGLADIHVVATDRGGLTAGWGTAADFIIHDRISSNYGISDSVMEAAGLQDIRLWTSSAFFPIDANGAYDYSQFYEDRFRAFLNNEWYASEDMAHVFDIENDFYLNDEAGRDRFARILQIANEVRPDLDIGIYRILPERSWHAATNYQRALEDADKGLVNYYGRQLYDFTQEYLEWHARNELFRTEEVSEQYGGGVIADQIDSVNPSLYTFFSEHDDVWSKYYNVELDENRNLLTVGDQSFEAVQRVVLATSADGHMNNGVSQWTSYFVVNADGNQFQISETENGPAVDFSHHFSGEVYVTAIEYSDNFTFNRNIADWDVYASENIAEARKISDNVNAWLTPSIGGRGIQYHSQDFFRLQLDILRSLTDEITIYESGKSQSDDPTNDGWWRAIEDFASTLDDPAATLTLDISEPSNPIAHADVLTGREDSVLIVTINDLMENDLRVGDFTQIELVSGPVHGELHTLAGRFLYQPDAEFNGIDSFEYRLVSGDSISNVSQVNINVNAENDAPVQRDDFLNLGTQGERTRIAGQRLISNDFDIDSDLLSIVEIRQPTTGSAELVNGNIFYTPGWRFSSVDQFFYKVSDGSLTSDWAQVTIEIDSPYDFDLLQPLVRVEDVSAVQFGIAQNASNSPSEDDEEDSTIVGPVDFATENQVSDLVGPFEGVSEPWKITADDIERAQQQSRIDNKEENDAEPGE